MAASYQYQPHRTDEETLAMDLNLSNDVVSDSVSLTPQLDNYSSTDCGFVDLPGLDMDSTFWDNFNPNLLDFTEPSFPASASAFPTMDSIADPSSFSFDTPLLDQSPPNSFLSSPDMALAGSASPSSDFNDSNLRLDWVKATLKDIALARAAADPRPVSHKRKQIDASIALYSELQNDIGTGFHQEQYSYGQPMTWQQSSTSTTGSSFDSNSFSQTGSPGSSTCTVPELSSSSNAGTESAPAKTSSGAPQSAAGGVQMILDLNMNEATSLPRKHRPKTQEERQRYIAVRKQGACEWHRKQRKRCTCVDKTASPVTTIKRRQVMKHTQNTTTHLSSGTSAVPGGAHWCQPNTQSSGVLQQSSSPQGLPPYGVPHDTWQCCRGRSCNSPHCPECGGSNRLDDLVTQQEQALLRLATKSVCDRSRDIQHVPYNSPLEQRPWDCDPGHALHSSTYQNLPEERPWDCDPGHGLYSPRCQNTPDERPWDCDPGRDIRPPRYQNMLDGKAWDCDPGHVLCTPPSTNLLDERNRNLNDHPQDSIGLSRLLMSVRDTDLGQDHTSRTRRILSMDEPNTRADHTQTKTVTRAQDVPSTSSACDGDTFLRVRHGVHRNESQSPPARNADGVSSVDSTLGKGRCHSPVRPQEQRAVQNLLSGHNHRPLLTDAVLSTTNALAISVADLLLYPLAQFLVRMYRPRMRSPSYPMQQSCDYHSPPSNIEAHTSFDFTRLWSDSSSDSAITYQSEFILSLPLSIQAQNSPIQAEPSDRDSCSAPSSTASLMSLIHTAIAAIFDCCYMVRANATEHSTGKGSGKSLTSWLLVWGWLLLFSMPVHYSHGIDQKDLL
ncbi:hypothetical protein AJ79_05867 [Helicocarpus griseus UAMH5409]|uniref:Uncharacterized protein n=1 Tax=Helicocarpus griseus UAMH5409 TaxID=1447875 RepID=A0A2B7XJH6_9EURO|nr:hypothetical protein AJ79_05867 [Helicocarpus griseus UAMH5409]